MHISTVKCTEITGDKPRVKLYFQIRSDCQDNDKKTGVIFCRTLYIKVSDLLTGHTDTVSLKLFALKKTKNVD